MKKSNGLITRMSATMPTVMSSSLALLGKTARARYAERVLLPVEKVVGRGNRERVGLDGGTRVRRWTQPDDVRPDRDRPVEPVGRAVLERDLHLVPVVIRLVRPADVYAEIGGLLWCQLGQVHPERV